MHFGPAPNACSKCESVRANRPLFPSNLHFSRNFISALLEPASLKIKRVHLFLTYPFTTISLNKGLRKFLYERGPWIFLIRRVFFFFQNSQINYLIQFRSAVHLGWWFRGKTKRSIRFNLSKMHCSRFFFFVFAISLRLFRTIRLRLLKANRNSAVPRISRHSARMKT